MPKTGGFIEPLVFMIVMGFIGGLIQAFFGIMDVSPAGPPGIGAVSFIIMLTIIIVISGFIVAALYFTIWKLMGSRESFETAYRCNAYISALIPINALVSPIPYAGHIITIALTTLFVVIASVHVHNLPAKKAWIVFGILGLIFLMVSISGEKAVKRLEGTDTDIQRQLEETQGIDEKINMIL